MDFSPYMIQKHALRLNAWRSEWSDPVRKMVDRKSLAKKREKEKRQIKREEWLKIRKEFPGAGRSDLRGKKPSLAYYLENNDKEWYESNSPEKWRESKRRRKKKWKNIDNETLEKVIKAVNVMKNEDLCVRINIHSVSVRINQESVLRGRILENKIPKTVKYLNSVLESKREFLERKLKYAVCSFVETEKVPSFDEFRKKARFAYGTYPVITCSAFEALRDYLEDQVPIPKQWKLTTEQTQKPTT
jgi:hypothetical protein